TVGRNKKAIQEYIKNQIQEDIAYEQMSLKEYIDLFNGESVNKGKK
ncbi:MAG: IS200/IS605 family transposase, partial [Clostridium sp.]